MNFGTILAYAFIVLSAVCFLSFILSLLGTTFVAVVSAISGDPVPPRRCRSCGNVLKRYASTTIRHSTCQKCGAVAPEWEW